jgi:hypothetical protein
MSQTASQPYRKAALVAPPFPFYYAGAQITDFSEANLLSLFTEHMASNVDGVTVTMTAGVGQYMYLLSPKINGDIVFLMVPAGPASGSWDGALWVGDVLSSSVGPRVLSLDFGTGGSIFYLYRTDFSNLGTKTWKLTFKRNQFT